ncbi:hypothetical protein [Singulisphaera acidiphila]|uniref:Uncharacterized protein n=1 Tax=Singulisphaera acidiphila (strain ATCC BAA-1392 / DSM 18658 / VKM B-2454 / MOB10) TaxID=886293 RepID=L0DI58_SINAD|nr:hypothetical protein [Singulisphaera acidiphila]AGA29079.1 hypothetical protein Sinac_4923 [Singulisphaera acidiphila DSM 18658]
MDGEALRFRSYSAIATKQRDPSDPALLAASVRDVAIEARRILNDSARNPFEVGALSKRINDLQSQVPRRSANELSRWLENLSREVDSDSQRDQMVTA